MMNYHKNALINECLLNYYQTFSYTLDTADYVPGEYNLKILAYIFKNMKKQFRKIDREDKKYQKQLTSDLRKQAKRGDTNNVQEEQQQRIQEEEQHDQEEHVGGATGQ